MLSFKEEIPYKSVGGLGTFELPTFAVIAGINGAGKTHFLEAVARGHFSVRVDGKLIEPKEVSLYDWTSFRVNPPSEASETTLRQRAEQQWRSVQHALSNGKLQQKLKQLRDLGAVGDDHALLTAPLAQVAAGSLQQTLLEGRRECRTLLRENVGDQLWGIVESIERQLSCTVFDIRRDDFVSAVIVRDRESEPLQQRVSELFIAYSTILFRNKAIGHIPGAAESAEFLSDEEFVRRYGPPPWDVLNDLLANQKLDFRLTQPGLTDTAYTAALVDNQTGVQVPFGDLSSGEKVLLALAMSLYGTQEERHRIRLPKLILLDEIDAPLHPDMVRTYLQTISELLVAQNVAVLLTTHSPTTVALCKEGSVHLMSKQQPRLQPVTNRRALTLLTAGVTALTVHFQERRQVFVESGFDADAYTAVFDSLRSWLRAEYGVSFLRSSQAKGEGGASVVRSVVRELRQAGVDTAFGVIDWDLKNTTAFSAGVLVVGEGHRYTLENYLFDPLLVAAVLVRDKRTNQVEGLDHILGEKHGTWRGLDRAPPPTLQAVADATMSLLEPEDREDRLTCSLVSGHSVLLPASFLRRSGHGLFTDWSSVIPHLRSFQTEAKFREKVLRDVVADVPTLLSADLLDVMRTLAECSSIAPESTTGRT